MKDHEEAIIQLANRVNALEETVGSIVILTPWQIKVVTWTANVIAGIVAFGGGAVALSSMMDAIKNLSKWGQP